MDAKQADPEHQSVPWTLEALRQRWNQVNDEVAPWWAENSKECYASGIADLVQALANWSTSKQGKGRKVGFPKFKSRNRDQPRVRFSTGAMRFEPDRRTIVVPVIGPLRSKENTRRVERHLAKGNARLISMTLSERWGRLFVAVNYAVRTKVVSPSKASARPASRAGVDLGMRDLATVADTDGAITIFPNPAPLRASLAERRRTGKQLSRCIPGSHGHRAAKAKLARLDRRCVNLRLASHHQFTRWLVDTYGEVVVEDLDLAAMKKSMGRRAFRRSVSDTALGQIRPMLAYKVERAGSKLDLADRRFPSSQVHHGCGCRLVAKHKLDKMLVCAVSGELVDRDVSAAQNLRDWPDHASCGSVGATAPFVPGPSSDGTGGGSDAGSPGTGGVNVRPALRRGRFAVRPEPNPAMGEEPREGCQSCGLTRVHSTATEPLTPSMGHHHQLVARLDWPVEGELMRLHGQRPKPALRELVGPVGGHPAGMQGSPNSAEEDRPGGVQSRDLNRLQRCRDSVSLRGDLVVEGEMDRDIPSRWRPGIP